MAESAVSLVIQNLIPLLIEEANSLKGVHEEVTSIRREMEMIQSFLKDVDIKAEKDDKSNVAKTWVKQVREEAYHIEDVIDKYILHFAKQGLRRRQRFYFLQKIFHITTNLKARHVIASEIQGIKKILDDIKKSGERYGFNAIEQSTSSNDAINDTWNDPRIASLFIEEVEVVGIESHRDKLINWMIEGPSNRMVYSVVGIGGLGKTTLVKKVYDNNKVVPHFDCRAWITVSQPYKMDEILREVIKQFYKARREFAPREIDIMKVPSLIEELKTYLCEQRYLVIFDDIWDTGFWDHIKFAFPDNVKGNRIIITTRNEDVAPSNNESLDYYVYKLPSLPFENALELFCKKAFQREEGQCPPDLAKFSHDIVGRCGGLPLAIVAIGGLFSTKAKVVSEWRKVLDSLSSERILSFSYHDLPYNLKACFLYFGMFPEDCAIKCARLTRLWIVEGFLIHRSLVQVDKEDFIGRIRKCRVHDMMHEVILSRSEELSFDLISARRLSIQNNVNTRLQNITTSQTRSILILGLMKIMDCEVGNLFHLRYLSLKDTKVQILPKSIVEISGLRKLRYLVAYNRNKDTKYNIDTRQSLQKLYQIEATSATLITELGSLTQLRKLSISKLKKENGMDLCTAIQKMSHLRSLEIYATSEEEVLNLQSLPSPPLLLQTLCLYGRLENIVRIALNWSKLMEDPLKVLQALPNLMRLRIYDGYGGEQLHIEGRSFQKLKMIIDEDCPQLKEVPSGIHHLKSLKKLLQPDEGPDFGKVKHIPSVNFWYRTSGEHYKWYKLGDSELLKRLRS
ncbi:hypothetical protein ACJW30_06G012000 [Castanea mollissima]